MITPTIEIGIDMSKIEAAFEQLDQALVEKLSIAVGGGAAMIAATAKQTRSFNDQDVRLRPSIRSTPVRIENDDAIVADAVAGGLEVFYAPYIEFGTRTIRERRFMRDAYDEHAPEIEMLMAEAVDLAIAQAGLS